MPDKFSGGPQFVYPPTFDSKHSYSNGLAEEDTVDAVPDTEEPLQPLDLSAPNMLQVRWTSGPWTYRTLHAVLQLHRCAVHVSLRRYSSTATPTQRANRDTRTRKHW